MLEYTFNHHCPTADPIFCIYTDEPAAMHRHIDFYEFCIFFSGSFVNIDQNGETICSAGHLLFYKPGSTHELLVEKLGSEHYTLIIRKDYFEEHFRQHCEKYKGYGSLTDLPKKNPITISGSQSSYLTKLASVVSHSVSPGKFPILQHLFETILFTCTISLPAASNAGLDRYVVAIKLLYDSYNQLDTNITDVCSIYPVSKRTILERFKSLNNCTIVEYRHKRRMEYAAQLLQNENCSIASVSNMLGFSCPSFFAKQFSAFHGITPKRYRALHQRSSS